MSTDGAGHGYGPPSRPVTGVAEAASAEAEAGEAACWAHLVCPECGAITSEGHEAGCSLAASATGTGC